MSRKPEIKSPSEADLRALKAAIAFADSEVERRSAQEKLDLATKLAQATKVNPRHRPEDEEAIKASSRRFMDLVFEHWRTVGGSVWDGRDSRIATLAIDSVGGVVGSSNPTHAFNKILRGFELMRRDGEGGDWVLDAIELIRIQRKPRS